MHAITRPSAAAGVALAASGLIAVTPVASPPDLTRARIMSADVRLVDAEGGLLGDLGLGNLSSLFSDAASDVSSGSGGLFDGSLLNLLNIPYNIIADIINIPYTESQALAEYAYALGPAGSTGGVEGWIPPGATVADGGVSSTAAGDFYTEGGTGSWWMESIGNTWGWDDGNWPQLDAILHFILPLQWTEGLAESVQSFAQSSFIDGAQDAGCEFECNSLTGYLGGWLSHFSNLFDSTYPITTTDTVGQNVGSVVNEGPGDSTTAIWSGQDTMPGLILHPIEAIWQNAIESPSSNPIMLPNIGDVFDSIAKLGQDLINDFDPFITGSFAYWGASDLYSIPAVIGGLIHTLSLGMIPNEFALTNNGAEPVSGYGDGPGQLLPNLEQGFQYLMDGLKDYMDPSTWAASSGDASTAAAASADASTLLGSLDHGGLLADLSSYMPNLSADLSSLGPTLASDLASMFPQLSADLSSMFPDLAASLIP
jgi:hypothetical protein